MKKIRSQVNLLRDRGTYKYSHFLLLKIVKFLKIGFRFKTIADSKIDILYVAHSKDFNKLNRSIASLSFIKNISIKQIHIISNDVPSLKSTISDVRVNFVDESNVLKFNSFFYRYPLEIHKNYPDRSGWLYQQFLKLGWSLHSPSANYIVIDADTYFIKPISFFDRKNRFIFFATEEWWPAYFEAFRFLFNQRHTSIWSHTAHMMIFNKEMVLKMLSELESIHNTSWTEAIAKTRIFDPHACFSEYETYANWMLIRNPSISVVRPSYNTNSANPKLKKMIKSLSSISDHSYL